MNRREHPLDGYKRKLGPVARAGKKPSRVFPRIQRLLKRLPDDAEVVGRHLADQGWYLPTASLPLGVFSHLRGMVDRGEHKEVERWMLEFARTQADVILKQSEEHCPERFPILRDAFEALAEGRYTLSIPAMLAQADGMSFDLLGASVFGKERWGLPRTEKALDELLQQCVFRGHAYPVGQIDGILLKPLRRLSALMANFYRVGTAGKPPSECGPLSRHGVLHGLDLNYATEANSLRVVLLIAYLMEVPGVLDRHKDSAAKMQRLYDELCRG